MAGELIILYTSILIDYFRKKNKSNTGFYYLVTTKRYAFAVSVITEYEVYVGAKEDQKRSLGCFFSRVSVLEFDSESAKQAVAIQRDLKRNNRMIAIPDLLIGATAKRRGLRVATKNAEHFKRISGLELVER